jgi:hypothetical protein
MSKKPTIDKTSLKQIARDTELSRRAKQIGGELLGQTEKLCAVVFLETLDDAGNQEPFSAIIYAIELDTHRHLIGRPICELQRNDSDCEEFQTLVRRAAGLAPAPVMKWKKA